VEHAVIVIRDVVKDIRYCCFRADVGFALKDYHFNMMSITGLLPLPNAPHVRMLLCSDAP
jgi:hypothetical protein